MEILGGQCYPAEAQTPIDGLGTCFAATIAHGNSFRGSGKPKHGKPSLWKRFGEIEEEDSWKVEKGCSVFGRQYWDSLLKSNKKAEKSCKFANF